MNVVRFRANPIVRPDMDARIGTNINGPSLIRVPAWMPNPLGTYYLYFAHHAGEYIRLAYADSLEGPWKIYAPGTLQLGQTPCFGHIASPDVHVDHQNRRIVMYYHGPALRKAEVQHDPLTRRHPFLNGQRSFVATSPDGIAFVSGTEVLGPSYFRVFHWQGMVYALGMPGIFYRSQDGMTGFVEGPTLFTQHMRHAALKLEGDLLNVFYSNVGDRPEQIVVSQIDLRPDWLHWQASAPASVLQPELDYEGADLPLEPSVRGAIHHRARQLRDPCIYCEAGRTFLLYAVAGESGIAIAELSA